MFLSAYKYHVDICFQAVQMHKFQLFSLYTNVIFRLGRQPILTVFFQTDNANTDLWKQKRPHMDNEIRDVVENTLLEIEEGNLSHFGHVEHEDGFERLEDQNYLSSI